MDFLISFWKIYICIPKSDKTFSAYKYGINLFDDARKTIKVRLYMIANLFQILY